MNVSFPLRDGYFQPLQCTREDAQRWKQLMVDLVQLSLREERPYMASQYAFVDPKRWKVYKEKDRLTVYQPRRSFLGRSTGNAQAILAVGTIEGTLDDLILGLHHNNTQEMRTTTSFMRENALDCAVLHVFENGTARDPLRSFTVKWHAAETPGGSLVINRDNCGLEYMGIDYDSNGDRYAFHVAEPFEHPVCPPFGSKTAVRAKVHTRIVFRQISRGRVCVFFNGEFSLSGRIPSALARRTAAEFALSLSKTIVCAEAKKLTMLAMRCSPIFRHDFNTLLLSASCSICSTRPGFLSTKTMTWCKICGAPVCSKCRSRRYLLSDDKKIRVSCCKQCLLAAKAVEYQATQPLQLIPAARWLDLALNRARAAITLDQSCLPDTEPQPRTLWATHSVISLASSSGRAQVSVTDFDNLLTPMSTCSADNSEFEFEDNVAVLESKEMAAVREEEEDDIPTLQDVSWRFKDTPTSRISLDDDEDTPCFARSAFTPAVAKSDAQAAIHREADRMSLYSQMRRLRDQAEDAYSITQANRWEFLARKPSTSSSARSTTAMSSSTSSYNSASYPIQTID